MSHLTLKCTKLDLGSIRFRLGLRPRRSDPTEGAYSVLSDSPTRFKRPLLLEEERKETKKKKKELDERGGKKGGKMRPPMILLIYLKDALPV